MDRHERRIVIYDVGFVISFFLKVFWVYIKPVTLNEILNPKSKIKNHKSAMGNLFL